MENCITCRFCDHAKFESLDDGFYYCENCGARVEDIIETEVAEEDLAPGGLYSKPFTRRIRQNHSAGLSLDQDVPSFNVKMIDSGPVIDKDGKEPAGKNKNGESTLSHFADSSSYEDNYNHIRMRYARGIEVMIQLQSDALVEKLRLQPLISEISSFVWQHFVDKTRIFSDNWADDGQVKLNRTRILRRRSETHNLYGEREAMILLKSLRQKIPLSTPLAITLLACHIGRLGVLPTDMTKWSLDGTIPYLSAFIEIEKRVGPPSKACPLSTSAMFRPHQKLLDPLNIEWMASCVAETTGLHMPPVNFYAISHRYLGRLEIPIEDIFPHACKIHDGSLPRGLWFSTNKKCPPTRVCVMSILIVAIRIIYNINGYGIWEKSFNNLSSTSNKAERVRDYRGAAGRNSVVGTNENVSAYQKSEADALRLLKHLDLVYKKLYIDTPVLTKDLPSCINHWKDFLFVREEQYFMHEELERTLGYLRDFYTKQEDDPSKHEGLKSDGKKIQKRPKDQSTEGQEGKERQQKPKYPCECLQEPAADGETTSLAEALKQLKLNMEENKFSYIPPLIEIKNSDYLQYVKMKSEGYSCYACHADYYIILRACAMVAEVDVRTMHDGVLSLENLLAMKEERICCSNVCPPESSCDHYTDDQEE